ncbi:ArnT family glycosyltransferase [Parvularcula marina]|uniref:ArnT family glycosyltransferase n=1 Tax=Parvularcula marina TaxID=2292771 RepID=UPI003515C49A
MKADAEQPVMTGPAYSLRLTLIVVTIFGVLSALVRRIAGDYLSMDDAKTNVFTQVWQWGYQPNNPPLFEWLIKILHHLTTGDLWSFLLVKYLALIVAAGFIHAAVRTYAGQREAFGTAIGMVLLYQVGWNFHQAFTHSALLLPAVSALIWAGLMSFRQPSYFHMFVLGLTVGISLLTKYNSGLFVAGYLLASLANPRIRTVILARRFIIAPLVTAAIILPHAIWFLAQSSAYRETLETTMGLEGAYWDRLGEGLLSLIVATISFYVPWAFLIAPLAKGKGLVWFSEERLLIRSTVLSLLIMVAAVVLFGMGNVSERYLIPVLLPAYVGVTSVVLRAQKSLRPWVTLCVAIAVLVTVIRVVTYLFPGPPFCKDCREYIPYAALEEPIRAVAPEGSVLIVREENTGGNLVEMFPASPVRVLTSFNLINPIGEEGLSCFYIWSEDMVGGVAVPPPLDYVYNDPRTVYVEAPWRHMLKPEGFRKTVWGITPVDKPSLYELFCSPTERG